VLARRFGDCKDKARLFCAMARRLGLEAHPILVNTVEFGGVTNWWPSPLAFDHVVVKVRVDGTWRLVDPTRTFQEGPLEARFVPPFQRGLEIARVQGQLAVLPGVNPDNSYTVIEETFRVAAIGVPSHLTVVTRGAGLDGERLRRYLASTPHGEIAESYRTYYAEKYPGLEVASELDITDDPSSGTSEVTEHYTIPEFWRAQEQTTVHRAVLQPTSMDSLGDDASLPDRAFPVSLDFPRSIEVSTTVHLPEEWPCRPDRQQIDGPAFRFELNEGYSNHVAWRRLSYRATAPVIEVSDLARYREAEQKIADCIHYELTWDPEYTRQVNWAMVGLVVVVVPAVSAGFIAAHRRFPGRPASPPPLPGDNASGRPVQGLGGWLLLIGLALVLSPVRFAAGLWELGSAFDLGAWHELTHPSGTYYDPWWAPAVVLAVLGNLLLLLAAVWLIVLFFGRHRLFPRVYVGFLILTAVLVTLDYGLQGRLGAVMADSESAQSARAPLRSVVACAIWIPYLLKSRRVRNTFVR
jgi:hypothetical protein